jgi:hypothetical protein
LQWASDCNEDGLFKRRGSATQPATAVLGTDLHQAWGRLPAHSRIHLFVRVSSARRTGLPYSDHADIKDGVPPSLPQCPLATICQIGYPLGSRRCPSPRCSDLALIFRCAPHSQELNPKEDPGMKSARKSSRSTPSNPSRPCELKQAILYIECNPGNVESITSFPYIVKSPDLEVVDAQVRNEISASCRLARNLNHSG